jgi:hypothetical protein
MITPTLRSLAVATVMAIAPVGSSACTVAEVPPPEFAYGYEPQYYDGYVVYYDDVGRPYYYEDGAVVVVPAASSYYVGLVQYGRLHRPEYRRWYADYGWRYRGYHYPRR